MIDKAIFAKAADIIEERGWYQGWFYNIQKGCDGPVCLLGAVNVACGREPDVSNVADTDAVDKAVRRKLKRRVFAANWNDRDGRTKEQVVNMLRSLAQ